MARKTPSRNKPPVPDPEAQPGDNEGLPFNLSCTLSSFFTKRLDRKVLPKYLADATVKLREPLETKMPDPPTTELLATLLNQSLPKCLT